VTILVPITLYGWIFVAIGLFALMTPRRAVLAAYLLAWLFLPQAGIPFKGFPDLDKISATGLGALIGVVLFDAGRLLRFRPSWVDLPIVVWCLVSIPSALNNELPAGASSQLYDGLSGVVKDIFLWGIPYFIGRLYFNDLASLRELAIGLFLGGLIYIPFCAYELKMSPQLHQMVYGFHPSNFLMTIRFGGWRPMVFMQHGLMVGMWMTSASLVGVWLWRTGALKSIFHIPISVLVVMLIVVTVLCKSTGAIVLLGLGLAILFANSTLRSSAVLVVALSLTPLYMFVRAEGLWDGRALIDVAKMISDERADSIAGRLENEDMLIEKASTKPWFGWGGWGGWRVYDQKTGEDITVSDGMWVIARGEKGMVGLVSVTAVVLLPFAILLRRIPARYWSTVAGGPPAALAMLLMLYSIDNLFNAMLNPIYLLAAGGLSGFYLAAPHILKEAARTRALSNMNMRQSNAWRPVSV
jgi:hypothetical protein